MKKTILEKYVGGVASIVTLIGRFHLVGLTSRFTQAEARQRLKSSKVTVIRLLAGLVDLDFLTVEQIGRTKLYSVNLSSPVVRQTKILISVAAIKQVAENVAKKLECEIYLYGSAARGEDTEKSDIDLLIIGEKVLQKAVIAEVASFEEELERKINFQIFTKLEWAQAARKDKPFYERVEKDKIRLA